MRVVIDHLDYVAMSPAKPEPIICWEKASRLETGRWRKGQGRAGRAMEDLGFPSSRLSVHLRDRSCADSVHGTRLLNCDAAQ